MNRDRRDQGAGLADNRVFLLGSQLYGFDRGSAHIDSESVALHPQNIDVLTLGWNGSSILVYDRTRQMYFYGGEQPAKPTKPTQHPAQYVGFKDLEEQLDIVKVEADGRLTPRAINVPGLKQTTTAEVGVGILLIVRSRMTDLPLCCGIRFLR